MSILLFSTSVRSRVEGLKILDRGNIGVVYCADDELVHTIREHRPDVAFVTAGDASDVGTLVRELDGVARRPRLVVHLMHGDATLKRRAEALGVDRCFVGPVDASDLLDAAASLLGLAMRTNVRVLARIFTRMRSLDDAFEAHVFGSVVDVSASGFRVETQAELLADQRVGVEFFLPGFVDCCRAIARVARHCRDDTSYGLEFADFEGATRHRILDFVARRKKRTLGSTL